MLIKVLLNVLIQVLFDDLTGLPELHPTLRRLDALAGFRICQRAASDIEAVRCTGGFAGFACYRAVGLQAIDGARNAAPDAEAVRCISGLTMMPERLHPTLRRSGALANFLFFFFS